MRVGAFLTVLLFLLMGVVGVWHTVSMDAGMSGCPLMARAATLCDMSPTEHIALWQRLFTAAPHRAFVLALSIAALGLALPRLASTRACSLLHRVQYQSYRRLVLAFVPLDPLKQAFSQGILHPKICG